MKIPFKNEFLLKFYNYKSQVPKNIVPIHTIFDIYQRFIYLAPKVNSATSSNTKCDHPNTTLFQFQTFCPKFLKICQEWSYRGLINSKSSKTEQYCLKREIGCHIMQLTNAKYDIFVKWVAVVEWSWAPQKENNGYSKLFWMWVRIQLAPESFFHFFHEVVGILRCWAYFFLTHRGSSTSARFNLRGPWWSY